MEHLDDAEIVPVHIVEPQLYEIAEFGADHIIHRLGKMIFESVAILSLERLVIVPEPQGRVGIAYAQNQIPAI